MPSKTDNGLRAWRFSASFPVLSLDVSSYAGAHGRKNLLETRLRPCKKRNFCIVWGVTISASFPVLSLDVPSYAGAHGRKNLLETRLRPCKKRGEVRSWGVAIFGICFRPLACRMRIRRRLRTKNSTKVYLRPKKRNGPKQISFRQGLESLPFFLLLQFSTLLCIMFLKKERPRTAE